MFKVDVNATFNQLHTILMYESINNNVYIL